MSGVPLPFSGTDTHNRWATTGSRWDLLVALPIEEVRRENGVVYVQTASRSGVPDHPPVLIHPGESLTFEPGTLNLALDEIDLYYSEKAADTPLAPVLDVWLKVGSPLPTEAFYFVLAAARRLDAASRLLARVDEAIEQAHAVIENNRLGAELQMSLAAAVGDVEVGVVALGRAADMANKVSAHFSTSAALDAASVVTLQALRDIRNAYEHIDDRALGQVLRAPHPDAHTTFDHRPLFASRSVEYGNHSVPLSDLVALAADVRQVLKVAAAEIGRVTP